jgi:N-acetylglutamate synthase-like GNAT family acetyltransferase
MAAALARVQGKLLSAACFRAAGFQSADKADKPEKRWHICHPDESP